MTQRLIACEADIDEGCAFLRGRCARMAAALDETGRPPLRRREGGFEALLKAICSQQLSVASADAVWRKLEAAGLTAPASILETDQAGLRAAGLSRQKAAYARALAEADLDYGALATMPEREALEALTAVKGIGVWTAEVYLMFAVGRADVFAPGDLALQEATRVLYALPERPSEKALREMSEMWSPWRGVAARLLWAYYRIARKREGVAV